jgi:hypothetical protein
MNRRTIPAMTRFLCVLAIAFFGLAESSPLLADTRSMPTHTVQGENSRLLARVEISANHRVDIHQLGDDLVAVQEFRRGQEVRSQLDIGKIGRLDLSGIYRDLVSAKAPPGAIRSPRAAIVVPPQVAVAERRLKDLRAQPKLKVPVRQKIEETSLLTHIEAGEIRESLAQAGINALSFNPALVIASGIRQHNPPERTTSSDDHATAAPPIATPLGDPPCLSRYWFEYQWGKHANYQNLCYAASHVSSKWMSISHAWSAVYAEDRNATHILIGKVIVPVGRKITILQVIPEGWVGEAHIVSGTWDFDMVHSVAYSNEHGAHDWAYYRKK